MQSKISIPTQTMEDYDFDNEFDQAESYILKNNADKNNRKKKLLQPIQKVDLNKFIDVQQILSNLQKEQTIANTKVKKLKSLQRISSEHIISKKQSIQSDRESYNKKSNDQLLNNPAQQQQQQQQQQIITTTTHTPANSQPLPIRNDNQMRKYYQKSINQKQRFLCKSQHSLVDLKQEKTQANNCISLQKENEQFHFTGSQRYKTEVDGQEQSNNIILIQPEKLPQILTNNKMQLCMSNKSLSQIGCNKVIPIYSSYTARKHQSCTEEQLNGQSQEILHVENLQKADYQKMENIQTVETDFPVTLNQKYQKKNDKDLKSKPFIQLNKINKVISSQTITQFNNKFQAKSKEQYIYINLEKFKKDLPHIMLMVKEQVVAETILIQKINESYYSSVDDFFVQFGKILLIIIDKKAENKPLKLINCCISDYILDQIVAKLNNILQVKQYSKMQIQELNQSVDKYRSYVVLGKLQKEIGGDQVSKAIISNFLDRFQQDQRMQPFFSNTFKLSKFKLSMYKSLNDLMSLQEGQIQSQIEDISKFCDQFQFTHIQFYIFKEVIQETLEQYQMHFLKKMKFLELIESFRYHFYKDSEKTLSFSLQTEIINELKQRIQLQNQGPISENLQRQIQFGFLESFYNSLVGNRYQDYQFLEQYYFSNKIFNNSEQQKLEHFMFISNQLEQILILKNKFSATFLYNYQIKVEKFKQKVGLTRDLVLDAGQPNFIYSHIKKNINNAVVKRKQISDSKKSLKSGNQQQQQQNLQSRASWMEDLLLNLLVKYNVYNNYDMKAAFQINTVNKEFIKILLSQFSNLGKQQPIYQLIVREMSHCEFN